MRRIANFSQTYQVNSLFSSGSDGRDREFLIDFLLKDDNQLHLRSLLDLHTFTFHNYDEQKARSISKKIKNKLPNTRCNLYNNMTLGTAILSHLQFLLSNKITDVLWIQDDEFSVESSQALLDFYNFYKNNEYVKNVSLCYKYSDLNSPEVESLKISDELTIYKTCSTDFADSKKYAMDFSAFICDIQILYNAFTEIDISTLDAYKLEGDFTGFIQNNNTPRFVLNKPLFKTYNVVGMVHSLGQADTNFKELQNKYS